MTDTSDQIVFVIVILARFLVPLTIPRYPLPGVIAALIIDAIDQTIFQQFTNLDLEGYQGYDKALDVYYLTIAYIATLRNWTNLYAYKVSRFLWYYRLFGVTLFELTYEPPGERWLLFIFPNTFEYFFIFYEIVRLRWDPVRLTKRANIIAAAFIWIVIKLPMEWWIHIAQNDTTDWFKENVFNVPLDAGPAEILESNMWIIPVVIALVAVIIIGGRWLIRKLPPFDWSFSFDADAHIGEETQWVEEGKLPAPSTRFFNMALIEKVVLVGLVGIIFAQILPDVQVTNLQLAVGTAFVIILNTVVSHWFTRRGTEWRSSIIQFVVMVAINFVLVLIYSLLLPNFDGDINLGNGLFFVLLLTLIVTLFDRYYPVYRARFAESV